MEGYWRFLALLVSALLLGFLSVIFSLVWVLHYREGLAWDGGAAEFNWHPVLMITGFVFVQGIVSNFHSFSYGHYLLLGGLLV
ncbi:UNVERIFIED_CONTAM: Cytochrome b reductase 1 [Gekko kuhli]